MKAAPIIKTIGELIQDTRRASNITLTQLSELSGINKGTISRIENGEVKRPEFSTAYPLATALGIPFETLIDYYAEIEKRAEILLSMLQTAIAEGSSVELIRKVTNKYLESPNEDSIDLTEKLYQHIDSIEDTSIKLSLYNLIIDYSRSHGIMPYIAKGLYKKYMIERNDFSRLEETYQSGHYILNYESFLNDIEKITLYYSLGVHAFSLMHYDKSIKFSEYVVDNDNTITGEYKANALFNICNCYYYLGAYENSQKYLSEYNKYFFPYIKDNIDLMNGCLSAKTGNIDFGILQLENYLQNHSEYNLIYSVTMLMDLYLFKQNYTAAEKLITYENEMTRSIEDYRTTPDKRSKLAHYYKLKGDLLQKENIEEAFDSYIQSALEYKKISLDRKAYEVLGLMTDAANGDVETTNVVIQKLRTALNMLSK